MTLRLHRLAFPSALAVAFAVGFGLARLPTGAEPHVHADAHGDGAHQDEADAGRVALTPERIAAARIEVVAPGRGGGGEVWLNGRVEPTMDARATVSATVGGRIERVLVAPGATVEAGQVVAMLYSGEAATLHAASVMAEAEAEAARLAFRRERVLAEQGIVARQALEAARARSLSADAAARGARAQVDASGVPDAHGRVAVSSPFAGVVGTVRATPGNVVAPGEALLNVSDPARTELTFSAPPAVAAGIAPGAPIEVAGPHGQFSAVVTGIAVDVDERGGMALIRAQAASGALPPVGTAVAGMLVTDTVPDALNVPAEAVQTVDGRQVVFVADAEGFVATPVVTGRRAAGRIEILQGLPAGARVAGANAFLLKAELAKGEAEHVH